MTGAGYDGAPPPPGVRARFIDNGNGLRMHALEAGHEDGERPCVLLLHGFPELAWSWRAVMPALAGAGYHVVAPDQRGYGRTTGWSADYDGDLAPFALTNLVRDVVGLAAALGRERIAGVFGHDAGSYVAACCALIRPDLFRSLAMMSAPFTGAPRLGPPRPADPIHGELAALDRPRKHYQWYYSTRAANRDMTKCAQGIHAFLRAYYHHKSADWKANRPVPLAGWTAAELAKMPTYYVMDRDRTMAETVAAEAPSEAEIAACAWLTEAELAVYAGEYARTGFQGGLQWYRCMTSGLNARDLGLFGGRAIGVPACFIAGRADWGIRQRPGALERMTDSACADFRGLRLIDGAGHWVQQEKAAEVAAILTAFLAGLD